MRLHFSLFEFEVFKTVLDFSKLAISIEKSASCTNKSLKLPLIRLATVQQQSWKSDCASLLPHVIFICMSEGPD